MKPAPKLKDHLTKDDGHELWDIADKLRTMVRGEVTPDMVLSQVYRIERMAKIADQREMPLGWEGTRLAV